jgi:hypothetical protein
MGFAMAFTTKIDYGQDWIFVVLYEDEKVAYAWPVKTEEMAERVRFAWETEGPEGLRGLTEMAQQGQVMRMLTGN